MRTELPELTRNSRLIVVLRSSRQQRLIEAVEILASAGVHSIEITLTTPGALEAVQFLSSSRSLNCDIGVGTVVDGQGAQAAIDSGAAYLVTPVVSPAVAKVATRAGTPLVMGAMTPTEMLEAWRLGASAIKLFPASHLGPQFVSDIHGPLPNLPVVPSGGIAITDAVGWLNVGCIAVSIGSPLLGDFMDTGATQPLIERTHSLLSSLEASSTFLTR
jgi:2-dehydro-3-deoxyphosphogluconate aldolase/(4S)-4-hydroxy-2-oxoglutarate aldolase